MRNTLRVLLKALSLACLVTTTVWATPDDRFHGGAMRGDASAQWRQFTALLSARYSGGPWDGFADSLFRQYDAGASPQLVGPRFHGGVNDGYGSDRFRQYQLGTSPRFVGGGYDGFDSFRIEGFHNPLDGDTDGDGLPDWWEARYYLSILATDGSGDTDTDHVSAYEEWVADSDPTNAASYFHIVETARSDATTHVTFTCSGDRVYDLLCCTNLIKPVVSGVPGATNITGSAGGTMTLDGDTSQPRTFYRVNVRLP